MSNIKDSHQFVRIKGCRARKYTDEKSSHQKTETSFVPHVDVVVRLSNGRLIALATLCLNLTQAGTRYIAIPIDNVDIIELDPVPSYPSRFPRQADTSYATSSSLQQQQQYPQPSVSSSPSSRYCRNNRTTATATTSCSSLESASEHQEPRARWESFTLYTAIRIFSARSEPRVYWRRRYGVKRWRWRRTEQRPELRVKWCTRPRRLF
ncbi:unnamed protein product [Trichogramma brassicae]|uniref:Uncharacterized protein n=1 Tax=Trichogramma brassicae TaxID=86971 RepID=A0A6H5ITV3_9HYME|nr:unnamed protein product [Trichogramma brassicae]